MNRIILGCLMLLEFRCGLVCRSPFLHHHLFPFPRYLHPLWPLLGFRRAAHSYLPTGKVIMAQGIGHTCRLEQLPRHRAFMMRGVIRLRQFMISDIDRHGSSSSIRVSSSGGVHGRGWIHGHMNPTLLVNIKNLLFFSPLCSVEEYDSDARELSLSEMHLHGTDTQLPHMCGGRHVQQLLSPALR